MENTKKGNWQIMWDFLKKRIKEPWKNPAYVFYFIIVIILIGTFGVFKELMETNWCWSCNLDSQKVKTFCFNVTSIGLSIVTASVIELIFISRRSIKKEMIDKQYNLQQIENIKKSIRIFGLCSLIVTFVSWVIINNIIENNILKIIFSVFTLWFSYFIWWISNVKNKILKNGKPNLSGILGGSPNSNTPIEESNNTNPINIDSKNKVDLEGDISNFKSE